jgi:hypothetical protein
VILLIAVQNRVARYRMQARWEQVAVSRRDRARSVSRTEIEALVRPRYPRGKAAPSAAEARYRENGCVGLMCLEA